MEISWNLSDQSWGEKTFTVQYGPREVQEVHVFTVNSLLTDTSM